MPVIISEETRQQFKAAYFQDDEIDEIRETAKSQAVVEAVGKEAFALQSKNFLRARIADIATQATSDEVVYKVIHDAAKLLDAGLNRHQITELAINASSEADVKDVLRLAQTAMETKISAEAEEGSKLEAREKAGFLAAALARFCPQSAPTTLTAEKKTPDTREAVLS